MSYNCNNTIIIECQMVVWSGKYIVCGCAALKHINVTVFAKRGIPTHD